MEASDEVIRCTVCGSPAASIEVRRTSGRNVLRVWFCERCARTHGVNSDGDRTPDVGAMYGELLHASNKRRRRRDESRCPVCGTRFADIRRAGKAGCPGCYAAFSTGILELLPEEMADRGHRGRLPRRAATVRTVFVDREQLKSDLKGAVGREDYEQAARIRDRLSRLNHDHNST